MSRYPQHEKLSQVAESRRIVEEFVKFLMNHHTATVTVIDSQGDADQASDKQFEKLIAEFFHIDYGAFEIEQKRILKEIRDIEEAFRNGRGNTERLEESSTEGGHQ